jgi:hypothetical protein
MAKSAANEIADSVEMTRQIVQSEGYVCPEIVSPDELLGEEP